MLPCFVWRGLVTASKGEGSVDVSDGICFAGLDVHARKTAAAAIQLGSGEVWKAQLAGSPTPAIEWLRTLPGPVRAVYKRGRPGSGWRAPRARQALRSWSARRARFRASRATGSRPTSAQTGSSCHPAASRARRARARVQLPHRAAEPKDAQPRVRRRVLRA